MPDTSGELYYLKDRRRSQRAARRSAESPSDEPYPADSESRWIARLLLASAAYLVAHWLAVGLGLLTSPASSDARAWLYAFLPANLGVSAAITFAAWSLLRRAPRVDAALFFSAGLLVFLVLVRLFQGTFAADPTIGERLHTLAIFGLLFVGSAAAMHGLRMRRDG